MSVHIAPLRLDAFDQLPKHARRCVFWEVDPATVGDDDHLSDPEFEKEAWLSMVMLEWGSCGQVATVSAPQQAAPDQGLADEPFRGYILYAPPNAVPRANRMPTGPVSADAVLLTSMGVEPGSDDDLAQALVAMVVGEMTRRGVRALEAFGRTAQASNLEHEASQSDTTIAGAVTTLGDCTFEQCMIDADFLLDVGFEIVSPHQYFPRLRLELDRGLGWKAEVEAALERLLERAQLETVMAGTADRVLVSPGCR